MSTGSQQKPPYHYSLHRCIRRVGGTRLLEVSTPADLPSSLRTLRPGFPLLTKLTLGQELALILHGHSEHKLPTCGTLRQARAYKALLAATQCDSRYGRTTGGRGG